MKTAIDCIPCFIQQALSSTRTITDDPAVLENVMRHVLRLTSEIDFDISPPAMARQIHRAIRDLTGHADPYLKLKTFSNKLALNIYPDLLAKVRRHPNPFEAAVRIAIAGNIIDFALNHDLNEQTILDTLDTAFHKPINPDLLRQFQEAVRQAENILYLGDNAGEIIFDKLLIEQIGPEKITFAVRGSVVLNDATLEDARIAGLTDLVPVIDNGADVPGTILEECRPEFQHAFHSADLIIAKGQGNFETLNEHPHNIYFLFKVKCPVVSKHTGNTIGELMLSTL